MTAAVEAAEHLAEAAEAAAVESVAIAVVVALNHNNLWFLPNHLFENVKDYIYKTYVKVL